MNGFKFLEIKLLMSFFLTIISIKDLKISLVNAVLNILIFKVLVSQFQKEMEKAKKMLKRQQWKI